MKRKIQGFLLMLPLLLVLLSMFVTNVLKYGLVQMIIDIVAIVVTLFFTFLFLLGLNTITER